MFLQTSSVLNFKYYNTNFQFLPPPPDFIHSTDYRLTTFISQSMSHAILKTLFICIIISNLFNLFICSIVYRDDRCRAKPGVKAVMELLFDEDVDVILGPICSTGEVF